MVFDRRTLLATFGAALVQFAAPLRAQTRFPARPLKVIVPFAPGGLNDLVARILAPRWTDLLGQPVIVENVAGAGGAIGATALTRAEPNGYTALVHSNTLRIQPNIVKQPGYDIRKDFESVSLMLHGAHTLIALTLARL
jgi:tripartite-type tricarboxylate transporter receptor subunit TctC